MSNTWMADILTHDFEFEFDSQNNKIPPRQPDPLVEVFMSGEGVAPYPDDLDDRFYADGSYEQ